MALAEPTEGSTSDLSASAVTLMVRSILKFRSIIVAAVALVILMPHTFRGLDTHHDGYILAGAMSVVDGGRPHLSAFMQYGPVLPTIQAIVIRVAGLPLVAVRALSLTFLVATAVMMTFTASTDRRWPISSSISFAGALGWLVLSDHRAESTPFLAWPSTLGVLVVVATVVVLKLSVIRSGSTARRFGMASGALGGSLLYIRPQLFLVLVLGMIVVVMASPDANIRNRARWFLAGATGSALLGASALAGIGALSAWFAQAIAYPFGFFIIEQPLFENDRGLVGSLAMWLFRAFIVLIPISLAALWYRPQRSITIASRRSIDLFAAVSAVILVFVVLDLVIGIDRVMTHLGTAVGLRTGGRSVLGFAVGGIVIATIAVGPIVNRWLATVSGTGLPRLLVAILAPLCSLVIALAWAGDIRQVVASVAVLLAILTLVRIRHHEGSPAAVLPFIALPAIGGFTEALSTGSSRHFWWGLPMGVLLILVLALRDSPARIPAVVLLAPLAVLLFVQIIDATAVVMENRPDLIGSLGPADGIRGIRDREDGLNEMAELTASVTLLERQLGAHETATFLVDDGFWAISLGRYASDDEWFVRWGPGPSIRSRIADSAIVVTDRFNCPDCGLLMASGWILVEEDGYLSVWRRSS